ncbi:MAG: rod shape-determining protein MreC [Verrucomicrobia bacterium]|nr:rod shape-determining protein MreC [Verrucomicrobiota bacterium]
MVVKRSFFKWATALIALLLLLNLPDGCTARVKGIFKDSITPLQRVFLKSSQSLKEGADAMRGFGGLLEKNNRLSEEVIYLQAKQVELENLDQENRHLQDQLDFYRKQKHTLIPCQVTARTINGWWQSVRLDKGRVQGVEANRAVISPDGLVGRTASVSLYTADVLLLSDPACKVSARVSRTGSFGLVTGRGVNAQGYPVSRMQFIHKDAPVQVGDAVVTSGLGGVFPKNILIGYIESISTEEAGLYQVADIIPKAVTELIDVVFVAGEEENAEAEE